jgi:hypothetical protein
MSDQLALATFAREELKGQRNVDPRRLLRYGYKVFSQADEDGIIAEIFRRIGMGNRCFIEIGVQTGIECNTVWLLHQQWRGLWIEADAKSVKDVHATHAQFVNAGRLKVVEAYASVENVNRLVADYLDGADCDLLSIDIDYNDYWVWRALTCIRPRVIVVEYNARWVPPAELTVPYDTTRSWIGNCLFGASLGALNRVAQEKGYSLVGCSMSGVNAFFVRDDLVGDHFINPGNVADHYEPARYFLTQIESGHPASIGPLVFLSDPELSGG